jgi:hypothetical protein
MRARDGRDGRDGADGRDGKDGARGLRGEKGDRGLDGIDGRDMARVPSVAVFDRDDVTRQTLRVRTIAAADGALLFTITPNYDQDGLIVSADITP